MESADHNVPYSTGDPKQNAEFYAGERIGTVQTVATPDGDFTVIVDGRDRVLASGWGTDPESLLNRIHRDIRPSELHAGSTRVADAVTAYYAGDFDAVSGVEVRFSGTGLQELGWRMLRTIPAGSSVSYAEFARMCGNPAATRAVAAICARNAAGLFVPCHRVLRGDGSLGGFAWGIHVKRSLLERESRAESATLF